MPSQGTGVFVSYSHADASLVAPVVKLLRVNKSFVFQDIDRIQPGKKWRSESNKALAEAQLVVVFWCHHANRSNEVSKEWKAAIEQEKDLLPLLLDATPLPPELSEFQWIDFRGTVGENHTPIEPSALEPAAPAKSGRRLSFVGFAAVVVAVVGLFSFKDGIRIGQMFEAIPPPSIVKAAPNSSISILFLVSVVLAITASVAWFLRWRSKREKVMERTRSQHEEIERRIAAELEAEILRRTTSREDADA